MDILIYLTLAILGAIFGSFAGAQVWRLRAGQIVADQAEGEKVSSTELKRLKPLVGRKLLEDRSHCLTCGHSLSTLDMIPVISWLLLRGKCRYCHKPIGWSEIVLEVSLATLFVLSVYLWPMPLDSFIEIAKVAVWLAGLVLLAIMFVYDRRWFLLPDKVNIPFIILGGLFLALSFAQSSEIVVSIISAVGSVAILSVLYLVLYFVSKGKWIGFGDVKLGLGMALFLADWRLAFVALFASNLVGTLLVLPGLLNKSIKGQTKIQFGPLMITGFLIAWFFGDVIVGWYQSLLFI